MFTTHLKGMSTKIGNGEGRHFSVFLLAQHNNAKGNKKAQKANDKVILNVSRFMFHVLRFKFHLHVLCFVFDVLFSCFLFHLHVSCLVSCFVFVFMLCVSFSFWDGKKKQNMKPNNGGGRGQCSLSLLLIPPYRNTTTTTRGA